MDDIQKEIIEWLEAQVVICDSVSKQSNKDGQYKDAWIAFGKSNAYSNAALIVKEKFRDGKDRKE